MNPVQLQEELMASVQKLREGLRLPGLRVHLGPLLPPPQVRIRRGSADHVATSSGIGQGHGLGGHLGMVAVAVAMVEEVIL
jgi:hypothetical protein